MSIEMAADAPKASKSRSHKDKSSKNATNSEKKRKRDHGEDSARKSKKHRPEKDAADAAATPSQAIAVQKAPISSASDSPFHLQTASLFLPLSPMLQRFPLEGICAEHLSPLILQYYQPLSGVVLSYSNPRIAEQPFGNDADLSKLINIDEYAVSWAWVTAEFLLFKPDKGVTLEGFVNLQNEGHIGLVCWNLFSASISRDRLPRDWKWVGPGQAEDAAADDEEEEDGESHLGHFVTGEGKRVKGQLQFRVKEIETGQDHQRSFLTIVGTMLEPDEEKALLEKEVQNSRRNKENAGRRLGGAKALGATALGEPVVIPPEAAVLEKRKPKFG